jgi:hypothetical protein
MKASDPDQSYKSALIKVGIANSLAKNYDQDYYELK